MKKSDSENSPKKNAGDWAWPTITDKASAEKAITEAKGFAALVTAITTIFIIVGWAPNSGWADVILFVAITIGLHFKSRVAAVLGLAFFCFGQIYQWTITPPKTIPFLTIVIALGFIAGVRGTFYYHRTKKTPDDDHSKAA